MNTRTFRYRYVGMCRMFVLHAQEFVHSREICATNQNPLHAAAGIALFFMSRNLFNPKKNSGTKNKPPHAVAVIALCLRQCARGGSILLCPILVYNNHRKGARSTARQTEADSMGSARREVYSRQAAVWVVPEACRLRSRCEAYTRLKRARNHRQVQKAGSAARQTEVGSVGLSRLSRCPVRRAIRARCEGYSRTQEG